MLDSNGAFVVRYRYDAWGKKVSVAGNLASTLGVRNPFRYRGYVYDEDMALYYQEARYYNPALQRFISADQLVGTGKDLLIHNIFSYCINRPVMYVDRNGKWLDTFFDVVSLIGSIVEVVVNPGDPIAWASLAADAVSLVVPGLTGGGRIVRVACKVDDVADAVKMADKIVDAGEAITSTAKFGRQVHKMYKPIDAAMSVNRTINKTIKGTLLRPDAIDYVAKVVYELKPYNLKSLKKRTEAGSKLCKDCLGRRYKWVDYYHRYVS